MAPVEKPPRIDAAARVQQEQEEGHKAGIAFATDEAEYRDLLMLRKFLDRRRNATKSLAGAPRSMLVVAERSEQASRRQRPETTVSAHRATAPRVQRSKSGPRT